MKKIVAFLNILCFGMLLNSCISEEVNHVPVSTETQLIIRGISNNQLAVEAAETTNTFVVTGNVVWTATSSASWCKVTPTSGKADDVVTVTIICAKNTATTERQANIIIKAGDKTQTVTVTQVAVNAPPPADNSKKYTLRFIHNNADRGWLKDESSKDVFRFIWAEREVVGFFLKDRSNSFLKSNQSYAVSAAQSGMNTNTITYSETLTTSWESAIGIGYFPYQNTSVNGSVISRTLPHLQNQSTNNGIVPQDEVLDNMLNVAQPTEFQLDNGVCALDFKCFFPMVRINIALDPSFSGLDTRSLDSVYVYVANVGDLDKPLNKTLAGRYSVDMSASELKPNFMQSEKMLSARITSRPSLRNTINRVWFIMEPVQLASNERLVVRVVTTDGDYIREPFAISEMKRNVIYNLDVVPSPSNTFVNEIDQTYYYSPTNNVASNCYVIESAAKYAIPLRTISGKSLTGTALDWLWASKEGGSKNFDITELIDPTEFRVNYSNSGNGYAVFRVGKKGIGAEITKGNVVLALKDAAGKVVWTWHIWITDAPKDFLYSGTTYFMDRNLGAMSADFNSAPVDVFGFFYRWGRSLPFFGGDGLINDEGALNPQFWTANQHTLLNSGVTWGGMWNDATSPDSWDVPLGGKSDSDPCPVGYQVPSREEMEVLHNSTRFYRRNNMYWQYNNGSVQANWPAAGMRTPKTDATIAFDGILKYSGTERFSGHLYYWTRTPVAGFGNSYRIYSPGNGILYSDNDNGDNGEAYPIRCVKMK